MTDFYKPRRDVLNYFGKLSAGYHRLIGFREVIEREAQIPDHLMAPEDTNNHDNLLGDMPMSNEPILQISRDGGQGNDERP